ncbi:MAG: hypothetical protein HWQ35_24340 [Nostoc sp. NMS1]|uniref:hypothetical protein n=1 Tax=unclassified Nostoc TaxID=2593658 RepID=UPI0025FE65F5|nr:MULTISPECIES: hypothetical protein [unclassified Nostoc]MBN3909550.1 hypothetical protein [Nostoc sp. NMS1]MBN3990917.1 hypothetical protein [Nostoc sp. NMS2]
MNQTRDAMNRRLYNNFVFRLDERFIASLRSRIFIKKPEPKRIEAFSQSLCDRFQW